MSAEPKCGFEWIDGVHENEHLCQLPPGDHEHEMHECQCGTVEFIEPAVRPPWRFDVPEPPDGVTALKDCDGDVWLRLARNKWSAVSWPGDSRSFADLIDFAPLVECPDPRAAS